MQPKYAKCKVKAERHCCLSEVVRGIVEDIGSAAVLVQGQPFIHLSCQSCWVLAPTHHAAASSAAPRSLPAACRGWRSRGRTWRDWQVSSCRTHIKLTHTNQRQPHLSYSCSRPRLCVLRADRLASALRWAFSAAATFSSRLVRSRSSACTLPSSSCCLLPAAAGAAG